MHRSAVRIWTLSVVTLATLAAAGCSAILAGSPDQSVVEPTIPVVVVDEPLIPTAQNTPVAAVEPTAAAPPAAELSFEAATYRDEDNGFEFDYPAGWVAGDDILGSRGSGLQLLDGGEVALQSVVYLWDPKNDLDAWAAQRKLAWDGSGMTLHSEETLTLPGDWRALHFVIEAADGTLFATTLTTVGQKYLELSSEDTGLLAEISGTLRPIE